MATERKEKLIRVLQIMQTTDEKTPLNATQIVKRLDTEYELEGVERRSIYRDIALLQDCGYDIVHEYSCICRLADKDNDGCSSAGKMCFIK